MLISHDRAFALEHIVRNVFKTDRGGVMNVAEADNLESYPMLAPIAVFAPLYLEGKQHPDIDDFVDRYCDFYFCKPGEISDEYVDNFIAEFRSLVKKYYDI